MKEHRDENGNRWIQSTKGAVRFCPKCNYGVGEDGFCMCKEPQPSPPPPDWRGKVDELNSEILRFVADFYPETNHARRLEHFLAEVDELKNEKSVENRIEEAADCALILFHMLLAEGRDPIEEMGRKLTLARERIETKRKAVRPFESARGTP